MESVTGTRENGHRVADLRPEPFGEPRAEKYLLAARLEPLAVYDVLCEPEHMRLAPRIDADEVHPDRAIFRVRVVADDELSAENDPRGGSDPGGIERFEQPFRFIDGEIERPLLPLLPVARRGDLRASCFVVGQIHVRLVRHTLQHRIHSDENRQPAGNREAGASVMHTCYHGARSWASSNDNESR